MQYKYIVILFLVFSTISCTKDFPDINKPEDYALSNSYADIFEAYWNGMNNNYIFWDIDPTDWNQVYKDYKPLFDELDLYDNPENEYIAYSYFKNMTANIIDNHYSLEFSSANLQPISPSDERKKKQPDYHNRIPSDHFYTTIPQNYLTESSIGKIVTSHDKNNNETKTMLAVSGIIDKNIIYLYFSEFALESLYSQNNDITKTLNYFFYHLKNQTEIKGIVIDVRGNPGGDLSDLNFLIGNMIDKPLTFGYTRSKGGNGRLDYSPWIPAFVTPQPGARNITAPIVVLADFHSVSMSEITTMAVKSLSNGHFIGERTWGGNGPLTNNSIFNGGQFKSPFFELIYTSSLMFKDNKGVNYEGIGLPPDIEIKYDKQALDQGKDPQLERALELIQTGK